MTEIWRDIAGYEGLYQVSNLGRVRSLDRVIIRRGRGDSVLAQPYRGQLLKPQTNADGYLTVRLCGRSTLVHRIVAQAFIGKAPPDAPQVDHRNGHRAGNVPVNLRWADQTTNNLNRHAPTRAASGVPGVRFRADRNAWQAYSSRSSGFRSFGHYPTKDEAIAARAAALQEVHHV